MVCGSLFVAAEARELLFRYYMIVQYDDDYDDSDQKNDNCFIDADTIDNYH